MNKNGSIDTIIEVLFLVVGILILFLCMFRFANWVERMPVKEKKQKEKVEKKVVEKKVIIESTDKKVEEIKTETKNNQPITPIYIQPTQYVDNERDNYLYDRFVINPTHEDFPESRKINDSFLSDDELKNIKNRKIDIKVNDVENLAQKDYLYSKISQMANENLSKKEQLLKDFEKLPREIKLILIENIMQKM